MAPEAERPGLTTLGPAEAFPEAWAELDRRLDPHGVAPLAVALSGGGDSLALLHLAAAWARRHAREVLALTVDHGLHPDSVAWTAAAGRLAQAAGVTWRPLAWTGDKPAHGLPAAARAARHALIAEAARAAGAAVVLFGHTADDVAESDHMRLADALTLGRLRAWGPSPAWPEGRGVFLGRPLLGASRQGLRDWLRSAGWSWLEDPANVDLRFARPRARQALAGRPAPAQDDAPEPDLPPPDPATPDGRLIWSRGALDPLASDALARVLGLALVCAGGGSKPPSAATLGRLAARIKGGEIFTATAAGARLTVTGEEVEAAREAGERRRNGGRPPLRPPPDQPVVWDGRYDVTAQAPDLMVDFAAGRLSALDRPARAALAPLSPSARAAIPALIDSAGAVALPWPFGPGPALAASLVADRFAAASGRIVREPRPD